MKKITIKAMLLVVAIAAFNHTETYAQDMKLGAHGVVAEYFGDLKSSPGFYQFKKVRPGAGVSFEQTLSKSFSLEERYSYAEVEHFSGETKIFRTDFHILNLSLKYKLNNGYIFKEEARIAPFLKGGIGASYFDSSFEPDYILALNLNAGAGLSFRLNDRVNLVAESNLNFVQNDMWDGVTGTDKTTDMLMVHSVGLVFNIGKKADADGDGVPDKRDKCPDTPTGVAVDGKGCPTDLDGDGIPDYIDQCKDLAGPRELNGCPDKDGDGIADKDDSCPEAKGLARFNGCPDTDGDGVEDSKDKCPNVKGLDIFQGCPDTDGDGVEDAADKCPDTEKGIKVDANGCPADTDGDGVIDSKDRCPTTKGDPNNDGCPVVREEVKKRLQFAARNINFETGKATLKTSSYAMLDEIVAILNEYKDYSLRIAGHTDDVGKDEANVVLSQARVDAVKSYLVVKGQITETRLESIGYGESKPIATNKTPEGRLQNRRVELELYVK